MLSERDQVADGIRRLCEWAAATTPASIPHDILARGARFFALGWALRRYGEPIRDFIEKRLGLIAAACAAILVALYLAVKYLGSSGALTAC